MYTTNDTYCSLIILFEYTIPQEKTNVKASFPGDLEARLRMIETELYLEKENKIIEVMVGPKKIQTKKNVKQAVIATKTRVLQEGSKAENILSVQPFLTTEKTDILPSGPCCSECFYPTQQLWAHKCPLCKVPIHVLCAEKWGIPIYQETDYLCKTCHLKEENKTDIQKQDQVESNITIMDKCRLDHKFLNEECNRQWWQTNKFEICGECEKMLNGKKYFFCGNTSCNFKKCDSCYLEGLKNHGGKRTVREKRNNSRFNDL